MVVSFIAPRTWSREVKESELPYVEVGMGDGREEFEERFDELFGQACRLALRLLGDPDAAEDVAAEALARTWLSWPGLRGIGYVDAWVLRVTTNLALDVHRRRRRWSLGRPSVDHADAVALHLALVAALRSLPRRQREVVVLRHLSDLSEEKVADLLGISTGTVGAHLHRGLAGLRRHLGDQREELFLAIEN